MSHLKVTYIALVPAITPTFMHGFQNNLAQLFSYSLRGVAVSFETCIQVCGRSRSHLKVR